MYILYNNIYCKKFNQHKELRFKEMTFRTICKQKKRKTKNCRSFFIIFLSLILFINS